MSFHLLVVVDEVERKPSEAEPESGIAAADKTADRSIEVRRILAAGRIVGFGLNLVE
jgi:hypothetical protein